MAKLSNFFEAAIMLLLALSAFAATASAQASAPAPSPDAGGAFSLPISGAVVGASLLVSALAVMRH